MKRDAGMRVAVLYAVVVFAWLSASDWIAESFASDHALLNWILQFKDILFVLVTSIFLKLLIDKSQKDLESKNRILEEGMRQTVEALSAAMDIRNKETGHHSSRVANMTLEFARLAGYPEDKMASLFNGAILHDIGKMALPDTILLKPGPLNSQEMDQVKKHPKIGADLLSHVSMLHDSLDIPLSHHERWDGKGYPRGLSGEQIPFAARLFSIVDVWDALMFSRVYKAPWAEDKVVDYIRRGAGHQFDPDLVRKFLENYRVIRAAGSMDSSEMLSMLTETMSAMDIGQDHMTIGLGAPRDNP